MFVQRKDMEREQARRLRLAGMSIKRIAAQLGVAVSSVSVWVRDIEPPPPEPVVAATPPQEDADARERHCPRCERVLPLGAFNRSGDGRQHWCRDCFRAYFRDRGDRHREQSRASRSKRQGAGRAFVRAHLDAHPCVDCGEDDLAVLEFDHPRGDKQADVARLLMTGARLSRIESEVARCDVVCVNCHRRRTATRAGTLRATGVAPETWGRARRANAAFVVDVLRRSGCVDCGERDPLVLDFDHLGEKHANVSQLVRGHGLSTIRAEIERCVVRCANCHRIRTLVECRAWRLEGHWAHELLRGSG